MNLSLSGIKGKLLSKADWVAFLYSGYSRFDGDIGALLDQFASGAVVEEIKRTLSQKGLLKYKLLESSHAYSGLFKMGIYGYILAELGIIPSKYKKPIERMLWGSGIAAITLPGSGPNPSSGSKTSGGGNSPSWGYNP